jgi:GR25 family glycosyltransferase involved in LPS biosynthesis
MIPAYYINLSSRLDRREEIEKEIFSLKGVFSPVVRVNAIHNKDNGAIGCAASHMNALVHFLTRTNHAFTAIFEDDFTFSESASMDINIIRNFMKNNDFDAIQLAYNNPVFFKNGNERIVRMYRSLTTSAYIVNRDFAYKLLSCFASSHQNLIVNHKKIASNPVKNTFWAIDVLWRDLQSTSKFYAIHPALGYQRKSISDIENPA